VNAENFSDFAKWLISGPEKSGRIDEYGGYQVRIDETDAAVIQASSFNRDAYFGDLRHSHMR